MPLSCSTVVLLTTNVLLTVMSVYWSISAWSHLHTVRNEKPWRETQCRIDSLHLRNQSDLFLVEFQVSNFFNANGSQGIAYRHGQELYNESRAGAKLYLSKFEVGKTYKCWLNPNNSFRLSMNAVQTGVQPEDDNLAAISTVLAVAAILSLAALLYVMYSSARRPSVADVVTVPTGVVRSGLSNEAIEAVIAVAVEADTEAGGDDGERVCAICLEDASDARLACTHKFHAACIRAWLSRGGETCPLCCATIGAPGRAGVGVPLGAAPHLAASGGGELRRRLTRVPSGFVVPRPGVRGNLNSLPSGGGGPMHSVRFSDDLRDATGLVDVRVCEEEAVQVSEGEQEAHADDDGVTKNERSCSTLGSGSTSTATSTSTGKN